MKDDWFILRSGWSSKRHHCNQITSFDAKSFCRFA
jgi:hypothetical protein